MSMIHVYTGNGKGKTTAALGVLLRTVGAGKQAAIVYFDKGGTHYSERATLEKIGVPYFAFGRDRIDPITNRFDFSITNDDLRLGAAGLAQARELIQSGQYHTIVLDEINSSVALKIIEEVAVVELLEGAKEDFPELELICTGRNATEKIKKSADLVTEMKLEKHYFYNGVRARLGIDY